MHLSIDFDLVEIAVVAFVLVAMLVWLISSTVGSYKANKKAYEQIDDEVEDIEPEAVGAVVLSKRMDGEWTGSATPHTHYNDCYFVTFLTDEGETKEFKVAKETFEKVYEGQTSTLVTVEGEFFGFSDGEEII